MPLNGGAALQHDQSSEDRALADRLVTYSDAVVAVAFVGVSGLGLAVADPDIRGSIARGANGILAVNLVSGTLFSFLLRVLRRWELDLRSDVSPSPKALRYSRYLYWGRHAVIWVSVVQAVLLMLAIR